MEQEEQNNEQEKSEEESNVSNAQIKNSELFRRVTAELAEKNRIISDREESEQKANQEIELKQLEEQGRFEEALRLKEKEIEDIRVQKETEIAQYEQRILDGNIRNELIKAGLSNELLLSGAVSRYNPETHGDVDAYVTSLVSDESNHMFFASSDARVPIKPPPGTPGTSAIGPLRGEKLRRWETSDDKDKRLAAIQAKREHLYKYPNSDLSELYQGK